MGNLKQLLGRILGRRKGKYVLSDTFPARQLSLDGALEPMSAWRETMVAGPTVFGRPRRIALFRCAIPGQGLLFSSGEVLLDPKAGDPVLKVMSYIHMGFELIPTADLLADLEAREISLTGASGGLARAGIAALQTGRYEDEGVSMDAVRAADFIIRDGLLQVEDSEAWHGAGRNVPNAVFDESHWQYGDEELTETGTEEARQLKAAWPEIAHWADRSVYNAMITFWDVCKMVCIGEIPTGDQDFLGYLWGVQTGEIGDDGSAPHEARRIGQEEPWRKSGGPNQANPKLS